MYIHKHLRFALFSSSPIDDRYEQLRSTSDNNNMYIYTHNGKRQKEEQDKSVRCTYIVQDIRVYLYVCMSY